jgi:hypothetical protein
MRKQFLRRIQKMNDWLSSFMMNQAILHLGARSCLVSNKSRNHRRQPTINTALSSEWKASTRMRQYIERIKKALKSKQRHPVMMEHRRGGTYISNQVRMHACHLTSKHCIYFLFVTGKSLNVVQHDWGQKKNHWVDERQTIMVLNLEREEDEISPTIRKISKKRED